MSTSKLTEYASDPAAFQADLMLPSVHGPRRFGDVMAPFQRERFATLNKALLALANGRKPAIGRHWWEATKGCSKDTDLAVALIWLLAFSKRRLTCQVGAADQDQAGELRKAAQDILHLNPWLAARVVVDKWQIKCEATGGACTIIAADVAGSHGARPDVLILNELSHVTKAEFAANLMDNATKVPHGLAVIATNAGFTGTWQHQWREQARTSPRWSFHQWAKPSPWIDTDEVEEARIRNSSSRFLRLFYGVWSANNGDALNPQDIEDAITLTGPRSVGLPDWSFLGGLDLGIKSDHAAFVVLGTKHGSGRISLVDCKSWKPPRGGEVDLDAVERSIVAIHQQLRLRAVHFDPYQAVLLAQRLNRQQIQTVPMNFVGKNLDLMASTLLEVFTMGTIDLYRDEELIRDLGRLSIVEKSYGYKLESTRDADGHADRATALAICLPAATKLAHVNAVIHRPPARVSMVIAEPLSRGVQFRGR